WSVETAPGVTISTKNATPNSQSSTQANPPNPSDLDITKWISTNDGIAKITYKYPASWQNGGGGEGTTNGGYYNTNFTYSPQRPRPGATNRIYDFSVNTYQTATDLPQNNGAKNLSEWLEKSGPSYGITNKEDFVLGGIKGYKTMVTGTVPIQYWFERGSLITHVNIYTSDSYGQKEIGEKIFSTLTFN
ncbi:MAG: hypothetical protein K0S20_327, partial [Patescibacteria group bacterium]|nr:hypothetical protein [Patescibacteria group bacterium]